MIPLNPSLEWEECACDWCGEFDSEFYFAGPDRLVRLPGEFQLVRCKRCGVFRQNPRLSWNSLVNYYPDTYIAFRFHNTSAENPWLKFYRQYGNIKRRKMIERFISGGCLLEVGCGTGGFLEEVLKSGRWDVVGIEPNEKAADYARDHTKATILQGRFADIELDPESFDTIVLWTVLEHLDQPIRDLKHATTLLKKNGWLFISIPNTESLDAKLFRHFWAGWDLPRHLYIFPRPTIREILEKLGLVVVAERCLSTSYAAFGQSLNFWSQAWEQDFPNLKKFLMWLYNSWPVRIILSVPLAILDRLNLTSTITIVAHKR